jgi:glycosyltransferase involved in cell wall biosynthesis
MAEIIFQAAQMNLFFDMTRLSIRMFRSAPTGIDRVEYAYAKELLDVSETTCVFTTPLFAGALTKTRALDLLQRVERAWRLGRGQAEDVVFQQVKDWLEAPLNPEAKRANRFRSRGRAISVMREARFFPARDLARAPARLNRWIDRSAPKPAVYFHCSHAQLDQMRRYEWLAKKKLPSVFFVHDAIPIEYPEFCSPGAYGRHVRRLMTVSKFASLAIVNSEASRRAVKRALIDRGARAPDIEVVPLGVDDAFLAASAERPIKAQSPYFLYVGTIEPRKNLLFLLSVWRRLVERLGAGAPRLVLAGRRGWENENIVDILDRSHALAPFIAEASDLTDSGLAALMAGAVALVAPSFAEGFGLPVVECLAAGTPALVSDIAAHREVGGDMVLYADPVDGPSWISAIQTLMDPRAQLSPEMRAKIARYQPMTWKAHVENAMRIIERVER